MERAELARRLGAAPRAGDGRDVVVGERDSNQFMAAFADAVASGGTVFVSDPAWGEVERAQFAALRQMPSANHRSQIANSQAPNSKFQSRNSKPQTPNSELKTLNPGPRPDQGWLCLPTGGSSGQVKLVRHDQDTLAAAAQGCWRHFHVEPVNAVGVLPLHHVSGLMAWMRCALSGGRYLPWTWAAMAGGHWPETGHGDWMLSLVPTQLQRLLDQPEAAEHLRRFRAILIGGAPIWPELLERAANAQLPVAPSYGMTETAAMIAALRPDEFLSGRRGCGGALPHAQIGLNSEGTIEITADSLFRGYYPDWLAVGSWLTEDLGCIDEHSSLHVLGRRDAIIITGGLKVEPREVESALRATGQFADVAVIAIPDVEWGEAVVACYPVREQAPDLRSVQESLAGQLAPHKRPKHYIGIEVWPVNEQGKVNRRALLAAAQVAAGRIKRNTP